MKLNTYKNYKNCIICNISKPVNRDFYPRNNNGFLSICRECFIKDRHDKYWKDGLLLCTNCKEYKNENEFSLFGTRNIARANREYSCKQCKSSLASIRRTKLSNGNEIDRIIKERVLSALYRTRHNKNIEFNISEQYIKELLIIQDYRCALSGELLSYFMGKGRVTTNISIDRIIPNLGYTIGNVRLVCMAVNQMRNNLTDEELFSFCSKILKNRKNEN